MIRAVPPAPAPSPRPSSAPSADQAAAAERMGATIRELRRHNNLTLVALAELTGLSHSFLSQVERGRAQPSMNSLHRIAQALGSSQDKLIAGGLAQDGILPVAVLHAGEGLRISMNEGASAGGSTARQLPSEPGNFYATEFVGLGREFDEYFQHEGNEFIYIAEGTVEVELGDGRTFLLAEGDSLRYPGDVPHRHRSAGAAPTRLLMVHTYVRAHPLLS